MSRTMLSTIAISVLLCGSRIGDCTAKEVGGLSTGLKVVAKSRIEGIAYYDDQAYYEPENYYYDDTNRPDDYYLEERFPPIPPPHGHHPPGDHNSPRPPPPNNPHDPNRPADPHDPSRHPPPNDPNRPSDPPDPNRPSDPHDPNRPSDPHDPNRPSDPHDPHDPHDPNRPADPHDPNRPPPPHDPHDPNRPADPRDPNRPRRHDDDVLGSSRRYDEDGTYEDERPPPFYDHPLVRVAFILILVTLCCFMRAVYVKNGHYVKDLSASRVWEYTTDSFGNFRGSVSRLTSGGKSDAGGVVQPYGGYAVAPAVVVEMNGYARLAAEETAEV
jgi:hypothetical protein